MSLETEIKKLREAIEGLREDLTADRPESSEDSTPTSPTKSEPEPTPEPTTTVAGEPEDGNKVATEKETVGDDQPKVTLAKVGAAVVALGKAKGFQAAKDLLAEHGVAKAGELKPGQYNTVIAAAFKASGLERAEFKAAVERLAQ